MLELEESKLMNAALYVLGKLNEKECDFHKVLKIFWFADLKHIKKYGRTITEDTYVKMKDGPVLSLLYDVFKDVRNKKNPLYNKYSQYISVQGYMIKPLKEADMDYLSGSDIEALDNSIEENRVFTKDELSGKSHGLAWKNSINGCEISLTNILDELGMQGEERREMLEAQAVSRSLCSL